MRVPSRTRRYKQHIIRQMHEISLFLRDENLAIDESVDYDTMPGMSSEVRYRLKMARPATLVRALSLSSSCHSSRSLNIARLQGQAKRLEGVTPASLASLMKYVRNRAARKAQLQQATAVVDSDPSVRSEAGAILGM